MAQSLAQKFLPLVDEKIMASLLSIDLEAPSDRVRFDGSDTVKIYKVSGAPKLSTYSTKSTDNSGNTTRTITGFSNKAVSGVWESWQLTQDRSVEFTVDVMDEDETLGMAFGAASNEVLDEAVKEIDAYRFATIAKKSGILSVGSPAALSDGAAINSALLAAESLMKENGVDFKSEQVLLYITPTLYDIFKSYAPSRVSNMVDSVLNRELTVIDMMRVIQVPQTRFYSDVDILSGSGDEAAGGYDIAEGASDINFLIVCKSAAVAVVKRAKSRIISPDVNQSSIEGWNFRFRLYHDLFVYDNKVKKIYLHKQAAREVADVEFSPSESSFSSSASVTLSCDTVGASIYYTTDGSTPDETDTLYESAISLSATTTIKAKAFKQYHTPSAVASKTYTKS